jgi:YaiO family outer membrane protein
MARSARLALAFVAASALLSTTAVAQDVLNRARQAPTRLEGLGILERHLGESPQDVDARLLYGLMLSWEGRLDAARRELRQVLEQTPHYLDARVGLMNVEWWSGNLRAAREQADLILSHDPGHPQARLVRQRLDAANRPWTVMVLASYDRFNDGRTPWREQSVTVMRQTTAGPLLARGSQASRFGLRDEQIEIEFYPSFRAGTYAYVSIGASPDHRLYPAHRVALDFYQNLGHGFEASGGYRRLAFGERTDIYIGALTKYVGTWMITGKVQHVPGEGARAAVSGHAQARRYFGADGTSFAGVGYTRGLSREEVRNLGDLLAVDSDTIRGQLDALVSARWRVLFDASTSREERSSGRTLWQTSVGGGFAFRF